MTSPFCRSQNVTSVINVKQDMLAYKAFRNDMTINLLVTGISLILSVAKYNKI
jgi:hypothetical protein